MIVLAGAASLVAQLYVFPSDVEPGDWEEPADYILERLGDEDGIHVHPGWTHDPLPHLEEVGDQLMPQKDPVRGDIQDLRRIWVLTETARLEEALATLPYTPSRPDTTEFGDVTVVKTTVPSSARYSYELLDHLDEASVGRVSEDSVEECKNWSESDRRWDCGSRDQWLYVGEHFDTLADDPHECIWAHPLDGGRTLHITFPDVPLQELLRIRAGLTYRASISKDTKPVDMTVRVGDETRIDHTYGARESTWFPHDLDTTELDGETRDVVVEVETSKTKNRWFCFNGWVE
jgi:hypothetical protein